MLYNNLQAVQNNNSRPSFGSPLLSSANVQYPTWGVGNGTFTRASAQTIIDHEGVYRSVASGSIGITGSRIVTNLLTYSEDWSNTDWSLVVGSATKTTDTVTFMDAGLNVIRYWVGFDVSSQYQVSFVCAKVAGSGSLTSDAGNTVELTVSATATPQRFSYSVSGNGNGWLDFQYTGNDGVFVITNIQLENVTGQSNTNPAEYIPTTSAPVSKCFSTINGNTVNPTTGVVTEATGAPLTAVKGPLLEAATTNKVTAYGVIPADTLGSELSSGTLTIGQKYQITARTDADFTADGSANNTVGTQFIATAATVTLDAGDKVKRVQWGIGEKSFHNGTAFVQNITGLTLSGDVAGIAKLIDGTTLTTNAGLLGLSPTGKIYEGDNTAGSAASVIKFGGTAGNTNPHSGFIYVAKISGSGTSTVEINGTKTTISAATITKVKVENVTTESGSTLILNVGIGDKVQFCGMQFEEQSASSSLVVVSGSTSTRAATNLTYPVSGNFGIPASIKFDWTPETSNTTADRYLLGSYTDANNWFGVLHDGTNLIFRKRVGGTNYDATKALTPTVGTTYSVGARLNADYTTDVFINGVKGTPSSDTHAPAATTTFSLGNLNGANGVISSEIKDLKIYKKALPDGRM